MPDNVLEYKGYTTCVNYSADDGCLHGKIEDIRSTVLFDDSEKPIVDSFHEAVDEYLGYCEQSNIEPEKPCRGIA